MKKNLVLVSVVFALMIAAPIGRVQALTMRSEITGQGNVLGDSTASSYPFPSGSLVNDKGTIYFISGTNKDPFTSYSAFIGLGYSLKNVSQGNLSDYTLSPNYIINTANARHPWGSWLNYNGTIYYSSQQGMIGVPSANIFLADGGSWNMVVKANKYDLSILQSSSRLAPLAVNDPRIGIAPNFQFGGNFISPAQPVQPITVNNPMPITAPVPTTTSSGPGLLNQPTLSALSPVSHFIIGGSNNQLAAVYNFSASGSPVTIQELDISVIYSSTLPFPPVTTVSVNGTAAPLVVGTSTLAGLDITAPSGGVNVPVMVNLEPSGPNNIPDNQIFSISLVGVKYSSQGQSFSLPVNVPGNSMSVVASAPTVSIAGGGLDLTQNTVLIVKVTVSSSGGGSFILNQLPLVFSSVGGAVVVATSSNMTVSDDVGNAPIPNSYGSVGLSAGGSAGVTVTFNSDNAFSGAMSKTYDFYLPVIGALGAPGTSSITTQLGDASGFTYTDLAGAGATVPGASGGVTYIANYPKTVVSAHN